MEEIKRDTYSVKEVAKRLGVSKDTVRRMIERSEIGGLNAGRRVLIPIKEVERLLTVGAPKNGND